MDRNTHIETNRRWPGYFPEHSLLKLTWQYPVPGVTMTRIMDAWRRDDAWVEQHGARPGTGPSPRWPIGYMKPGHSFYVAPDDDPDKAIKAAHVYAGKQRQRGRKFRIKTTRSAYGGVRIWRSE